MWRYGWSGGRVRGGWEGKGGGWRMVVVEIWVVSGKGERRVGGRGEGEEEGSCGDMGGQWEG